MSLLMIGMLLSGCGSSENESEAAEETSESSSDFVKMPDISEIDAEKYCTVAEYKGITLDKDDTEVSEESIDEEITYELAMNPMTVEDEDAKVTEGDTVVIDYVGKLDGEEFDGGSAEDASLTIGSGQFIDGFEDGLIGTQKGQTVDLNLTFPEDYDENLAGKDVVFTVTIKEIKRPLTEITDAWVQENSEVSTVEEFREYIRTELQEYNENQATEDLSSQAMLQVVAASEFSDYPDVLVKYGEDVYTNQIMSYAEQSDMTFDEYLSAQDLTEEEYEAQRKEYAENIAKQLLVVKAIADKEGFTTEDDEYKELLNEYLTSLGVTEEELYEEYSEGNVYYNIMQQRVGDLIMENAQID